MRLPFRIRSTIEFAIPALLAPLAAVPTWAATEDSARRCDAFDPTRNVAYAAKRSWARAVALYHSTTPKYAEPYRKKVIQAWNDE